MEGVVFERNGSNDRKGVRTIEGKTGRTEKLMVGETHRMISHMNISANTDPNTNPYTTHAQTERRKEKEKRKKKRKKKRKAWRT